MIVVYTSPGCASCRKVKQWLKDRDIPYIEKNIFKTLLNENEIKHLLMRSENGSDDIISKRSKIIQESGVDIESMTTDELVHFIRAVLTLDCSLYIFRIIRNLYIRILPTHRQLIRRIEILTRFRINWQDGITRTAIIVIRLIG